MGRLIIGLTGAFGSGTSFLADNFFAKRSFKKYSLSQQLKEKFAEEHGKSHETRHELQDYGNELRKENRAALAEILDNKSISHDDLQQNIVIDSIRNPAEIKYFREKYPEFILIGVFADYDVRWDRVKILIMARRTPLILTNKKIKEHLNQNMGRKFPTVFLSQI